MGKEKGTFVKVGKLLESSCKSKYMKIQSFRSKYEQCLCEQAEL